MATMVPFRSGLGQVGRPARTAADLLRAPTDDRSEAYIKLSPDVLSPDGEATHDSTAKLLRGYMREFRDHPARVLTVLPRSSSLLGRSWRMVR